MSDTQPTRLGKYEILADLGKGGFATVYRAHDPDLGREVALKVLDPLLMRDPAWVARFRQEARVIAALDHPRIIPIYEIGQAEGILFIAMKLLEGGSLADRIAQGPLPWAEVVRLTGEIADGLDFAHSRKVLHRDLKPGNVLLDADGHAVLTDFGFARLVADHSLSVSVSGGVVGTPAYIAPEVWEGEPPGRPADLYALGCIVYEMAAGAQPFRGATTPAVMRAHFQPLALPAQWPESTPPGLGEVLGVALAKAPAERYARAGELAEAVANLTIDTLAEPYAALQAAVAGGRWSEALTLAGQIRAQRADYRDVVALEAQALAGQERAARADQAAAWRTEAEAALAQGDRSAAALAAKQWAALTPEDPALVAFRGRLAPLAAPAEDPQPTAKAAPEPGVTPNLRPQPVQDKSTAAAAEAPRQTAAQPPVWGQGKEERTVGKRRLLPWVIVPIAFLALMLAFWRPWTENASPLRTDAPVLPTMAPAAAATSAPAVSAATGKVPVGIVLPNQDEPRWVQDAARFKDALAKAGFTAEILFSQGDSAKEKANVEALIREGIKVLIICPQDSTAAAAAAQEAHDAGIKVISYDRLILDSSAVDYYVTFDAIAIGAQQGQYLIDKAGNTKGNPLYLYAGNASNNNTFAFFQGVWAELQPKIVDGTFVIKNSSKAVALQGKAQLTHDEMTKIIDQVATNWDYYIAQNLAAANLTAAKVADKGTVFIASPNDGTARAIADVFAADKDVMRYYITGQDAEIASIQYIIDGKQSMTVLKDVRTLANDAVAAALAYLQGRTPENTIAYNNGKIDVPSRPSALVTVTKDNVKATVIDSGYYPADYFSGLKRDP